MSIKWKLKKEKKKKKSSYVKTEVFLHSWVVLIRQTLYMPYKNTLVPYNLLPCIANYQLFLLLSTFPNRGQISWKHRVGSNQCVSLGVSKGRCAGTEYTFADGQVLVKGGRACRAGGGLYLEKSLTSHSMLANQDQWWAGRVCKKPKAVESTWEVSFYQFYLQRNSELATVKLGSVTLPFRPQQHWSTLKIFSCL